MSSKKDKCKENSTPRSIIGKLLKIKDKAENPKSNNIFFSKFVCFFFLILFIYLFLFLPVLGLRFCARAFSSCGKRGPLFIAVHGPLTIAASLVAEHRLQTCRLSNCGSLAQLLRGMWDLPRPGLEPVCPALAGRLSTTAPPGKPKATIFLKKEGEGEGERVSYQLTVLMADYGRQKTMKWHH